MLHYKHRYILSRHYYLFLGINCHLYGGNSQSPYFFYFSISLLRKTLITLDIILLNSNIYIYIYLLKGNNRNLLITNIDSLKECARNKKMLSTYLLMVTSQCSCTILVSPEDTVLEDLCSIQEFLTNIYL